ncbi:SGF29 tudor-like domain-containing protein [Xylogone sp. PMI_703]|nr:SGF29 tudor-like domain-containing protein [Xylogone sp. PMI_703]
MSSQRSRAPRGGSRPGGHDSGEEAALWARIQDDLQKTAKLESRAREVGQQIIDMELGFKAKEPDKPSVQEIDALSALYRENVRISETLNSLLKGEDSPMQKLQLLNALVKHNEETLEASLGRGTSSRESRNNGMELDGPADSPVPSPAEHKPIRKLGSSRTSSLPPKDKDGSVKPEQSDHSEAPIGKTKVTFALGADVAFKPKIQGQTEEHDWIQGIVVKVIGEGKSRRYDVQDPYPDEITKKPGQIYRSSASSMVPIPPVGAPLPDYEVGKHVLALYPETTTFYRAEVKAMKGDKVELLFEDEEMGKIQQQDRRFVLDYKG